MEVRRKMGGDQDVGVADARRGAVNILSDLHDPIPLASALPQSPSNHYCSSPASSSALLPRFRPPKHPLRYVCSHPPSISLPPHANRFPRRTT